MPITELW